MHHGLALAHLYGWTVGRKSCSDEPVIQRLQVAVWLHGQDHKLQTERPSWRPYRSNWRSRIHLKSNRPVYLDDIAAADAFLGRVDEILCKENDSVILCMHLFDGLSAREVGRKLGIDHKTVAKRAKDAVTAIVKASPKLGPNSPRCGKTKASSQKSPPNKDFRHVEDRSEKCDDVIRGKNQKNQNSDSQRNQQAGATDTDPFSQDLFNDKGDPINRAEIRRRTDDLVEEYEKRGGLITIFAPGLAWGVSLTNIRGIPLSGSPEHYIRAGFSAGAWRWRRAYGAKNADQELTQYFQRQHPKQGDGDGVMDRRYGAARGRSGNEGFSRLVADNDLKDMQESRLLDRFAVVDDDVMEDKVVVESVEGTMKHDAYVAEEAPDKRPADDDIVRADIDADETGMTIEDGNEAQRDDSVPPENKLRQLKLPEVDDDIAPTDGDIFMP
jgi:hypothetical protein